MKNVMNKLKMDNSLTEFRDPFKKEKVVQITFNIFGEPSFTREEKCMEAMIRFNNGPTSGEQKIFSNEFPDLVSKVKTFVDAL